jgi:hypothetical protein
MNPKRNHIITPLDKDAHLLIPGLRYARSMLSLAIQVSRHSALRGGLAPPLASEPPLKKKS